MSWVWGQASDEEPEPGAEEPAWCRTEAEDSDRSWTPGQRAGSHHDRRWDSDQQLDHSLELESDKESDKESKESDKESDKESEKERDQSGDDRLPSSRRHQTADVR